jgi:hypothetical protein
MNLERLAEEYLKRKKLQEAITKQVSEIKDILATAVDEQGILDDKGHKWLTAGKYSLQRQKRQGSKYLDRAKAEAWAKEDGFWDAVKVTREELSEDALLGYVFDERRTSDGIEATLESMYVEPAPTWAFQSPILQEDYEY